MIADARLFQFASSTKHAAAQSTDWFIRSGEQVDWRDPIIATHEVGCVTCDRQDCHCEAMRHS